MSNSLKLTIMIMILLAAFVGVQHMIPAANAPPPVNAIQNPGFESSTDWETCYSYFQGSFAKIQDSTCKHTGSYSGLTQTNNPKQELCSASLYQDLNVEVLKLSTFSYWVRKGSSAANGYYYGKVGIYLTGNNKLFYYHGFDGSSPPSDGTYTKYINVGNPRRNFWILVSRNLLADLADKFGASITTHNITGIELISHGTKNLVTGNKYGQIVNWDDLNMPKRASYTIDQDPRFENKTVRWDGPNKPIWWNVTVNVCGYYDHQATSSYYYVEHKVGMYQVRDEDFEFEIINFTCYGLDSNEELVYMTTFIGDHPCCEYFNTTGFVEDDVEFAYTYIYVNITDRMPGYPPYYLVELTASIALSYP